MKKLALIILIALSSISTYGQNISGQWNGLLKVQSLQLRIVLHITETDTAYTATMDSPDQGAKGIPITYISYKDSILVFKLSSLGVHYEASLNKENVFDGIFKQNGQTFPLSFTRGEVEKEKVTRPQEPKKPYPYYSEDVQFENKQDSIVLSGTLTLPNKEGHFPAVVLISGSGPQNRDEEIFDHKPFLVLADYLTKNGIAVLRYDDRGVAKSTGNFSASTSNDFATDVENAVSYLLSRKEIDKNKIGLIGHSEGGIIAPMVASRSDDVGFIVLMAGLGISGSELLVLQSELIGRGYGINESNLQIAKTINRGAYDLVLKTDNLDSLKTKLVAYIKLALKENPTYEMPKGMTEEIFIEKNVKLLATPWMRYFLKYDPKPVLEKVSCPVLAINGEKDLQVPSNENLKGIEEALVGAGNHTVTTKELPNLNHMFQESETGLPQEYGIIEQTFSLVALETISDWIKEQVK